MQQPILQLQGDTCLVKGELSFVTVTKLRKEGEQLLSERESLLFDLSAAVSEDNSALSLLTVWSRFAKQHHCKINFINLPPKLSAMLRLSGLNELLPIE